MASTSLRERMRQALRIRNLSPRTEHIYIDLVARFSLHFHGSPDRLGLPEIAQSNLAPSEILIASRSDEDSDLTQPSLRHVQRLVRHVPAEAAQDRAPDVRRRGSNSQWDHRAGDRNIAIGGVLNQ